MNLLGNGNAIIFGTEESYRPSLASFVGREYIVIHQLPKTVFYPIEYYVAGSYIAFFTGCIYSYTGKMIKLDYEYSQVYYSSAGKGYRFVSFNATCTSCNGTVIKMMIADAHLAVFRVYAENARYRPLGEEFASALEFAVRGISYRWVNSVRVVYAGMHAPKMIYTNNVTGLREKYGNDIYIVNETDHYIVYVHPYEKYYVYLNGIRVVYPVIVKGTYEEDTGGIPFTYMFSGVMAPLDSTAVTKRVIDRETVDEIAEAYTEMLNRNGIDNNTYTAEQLWVYDYFLSPYKYGDEYTYTPMLVVGLPRSTVFMWIQIRPGGGIKIKLAAVLLGGYTRSDPEINLKAIFTPTDQPPGETAAETNTTESSGNETQPGETFAETNTSHTGVDQQGDSYAEIHMNTTEPPGTDGTGVADTLGGTNTSTSMDMRSSNTPATRDEAASILFFTAGLIAGIALGVAIATLYSRSK